MASPYRYVSHPHYFLSDPPSLLVTFWPTPLPSLLLVTFWKTLRQLIPPPRLSNHFCPTFHQPHLVTFWPTSPPLKSDSHFGHLDSLSQYLPIDCWEDAHFLLRQSDQMLPLPCAFQEQYTDNNSLQRDCHYYIIHVLQYSTLSFVALESYSSCHSAICSGSLCCSELHHHHHHHPIGLICSLRSTLPEKY